MRMPLPDTELAEVERQTAQDLYEQDQEREEIRGEDY